MILLFGGRLLDVAVSKTFVTDEHNYIGNGLYLWQSGDYHFQRALNFHPPLTYHLASLPLLVLDVELDEMAQRPRVGERIVRRTDLPIDRIRVASRLPFILLSCWGALLCFFFAREVAGQAAGFLALFLFTFSPMILAFGALAHSDITSTVFWFQALYTWWRWLQKPGWPRLLVCGLSLGLAVISKATGIFLACSLGLLTLEAILRLRPSSRVLPWVGPDDLSRRALWLMLRFAALVGVAIVVFWVGYGFSFALTKNPGGWLEDIPVPGYLHGIFFDMAVNAKGRVVSLMGEFSERGWLHYFAVAVAIKESVAILALLAAAFVTIRRRGAGLGRLLAVPTLFYGYFAVIWLDVPLGVRYLLPLVPLAYLFTATQLGPLLHGSLLQASPQRAQRVAVLACCALLLLESAWIHPHYIANFNFLIGGPRQGHHWLLESNIDWGQDLRTLAEYLEERGNPPVHLAYTGVEQAEFYGIRSVPLTGCEPVSGLVAISVNVLMRLYAAGDIHARPPEGCYDWLLDLEPVARPGYSIHVYEVPADDRGGAARGPAGARGAAAGGSGQRFRRHVGKARRASVVPARGVLESSFLAARAGERRRRRGWLLASLSRAKTRAGAAALPGPIRYDFVDTCAGRAKG